MEPPFAESLVPFVAPDCLACGACCFASSPLYVRVSGADWSRLGDEADRWAEFAGHRAYLKTCDGRCAALAIGTTGAGEARFVCTVYERRPAVCRDLEPGSSECEAEWLRKRALAQAAAERAVPLRSPEFYARGG